MDDLERISDRDLAGITGGVAPRGDNPFTKQMHYELGMAGLRRLITAAGGKPLPPYVPPRPKEPAAHPFTWSVGFISRGPYG